MQQCFNNVFIDFRAPEHIYCTNQTIWRLGLQWTAARVCPDWSIYSIVSKEHHFQMGGCSFNYFNCVYNRNCWCYKHMWMIYLTVHCFVHIFFRNNINLDLRCRPKNKSQATIVQLFSLLLCSLVSLAVSFSWWSRGWFSWFRPWMNNQPLSSLMRSDMQEAVMGYFQPYIFAVFKRSL